MKRRALRLSAALAGLLLALSLCACGAGEEEGFAGEVLQISDAEVLVSVLPNDSLRAQATQVAFPLDAIGGRENLEATVGDTVTVVYLGPVPPGEPATVDARECGLLQKEFCGVIDRIGAGTAVIEPLATEEIAQEAGQLSISLQQVGDKGFQVGDVVSVTYVRGVVPGSIPQVDARDWGLAE